MPTDSVTWRNIRQDFESLPDGDWALTWTALPSISIHNVQFESNWLWTQPLDVGLQARASAIFLKAAKARGYSDEGEWLDELRYTDFVQILLKP